MANALAARCAVTLVQLRPPNESIAAADGAGRFERVVALEKDRSYTPSKILQGLIGPSPLPVLNYSSPQAANGLRQLLLEQPFDGVQVEGIHLLSYLAGINALPQKPAIVVDWHNIESELMRRYAATEANWPKRLAARRTATLLERAEQRLLSGAPVHTVASAREREVLLARSPRNDIRVIPNGVETSRFLQIIREGPPAAPKRSLLFVGSMDYHANIDGVTWFARAAWPAIHAAFPDLIFTIVGREPVPEIRNLASGSVRVTGTVDDVLPYYRDAFAVIVPLRVGGGTRLKILEAMAAGVPVISTALGAEGIEVTNDTNILLADDPAQILSALQRLHRDTDLQRRLAAAGRLLVAQKYDWDVLGEALYLVHQERIAAARP